jgi:four helix bundle protein
VWATSPGVGSAGFHDLAVYRATVRLADELHAAVAVWSAFELWTLGIQLVKAADSVGANIAEAYGRRTDADRRRFLTVARGSICELQHWLDRATERDLGYPSHAIEQANEVGRMLNGLCRSWSSHPSHRPSD